MSHYHAYKQAVTVDKQVNVPASTTKNVLKFVNVKMSSKIESKAEAQIMPREYYPSHVLDQQ